MIIIKNNACLKKMATAGYLLQAIFDEIAEAVVPGVSTFALDKLIEHHIKSKNLVSTMKGYLGYKHVSCISVNDEVVHGVPSVTTLLKESDLVKIDVCVSWKGYCADMARPFFVGTASPKAVALARAAQSALDKGIAMAVVGNRLSDISAAIQQEVELAGYGIVRDFAGHGIGKSMHEDPEILNYGVSGRGPVLRVGMVFALEPMITAGSHEIFIAHDKWTAKTCDGSLAMHVEDTVAITSTGPHILTRKN